MVAADTARAIAAAALGGDPGPLDEVPGGSHQVFVGPRVVVKVGDPRVHNRLGRELALAPHLPAGITAPVLGSGTHQDGTHTVNYACYARLPGTSPGMGLPGVDRGTARRLASQAVERLQRLHNWLPAAPAAATLAEELDHGGFTSRATLIATIDGITALDQGGVVPRHVIEGLSAIADHAPDHAPVRVPVHADCHWGNWLAQKGEVTALLDLEWARLGDPADDWFFLTRFSGPHLAAVLDVIVAAIGASLAELSAGCEVREAAYLASDLRLALANPATAQWSVAECVTNLDTLVTARRWHR